MTRIIALLLMSASAIAGSQSPLLLELVADGFSQPLAARHAGDGSGRMFVVEKGGVIRVVSGSGELLDEPFIDLGPQLPASPRNEQGLLGLDFHPDFEVNGLFFVNYTDSNGDTVIQRFSVSGTDPNQADANSGVILIRIVQNLANHNGGDIHFGPDGYLYIGMGDGGGGGDPQNRAQNPLELLGKMLRIDVDNPGQNIDAGNACGDDSGGPVNYGIPADNPFLGADGVCDEIWALGLRNPFRFSFDRETGDLFIGDVGQNSWEEISFQPANSTGGVNFGWDCREGAHDFGNSAPVCTSMNPPQVTDPILEYFHDSGRRSITGGYRYRGPDAFFTGNYFYGDFSSGEIFIATETSPGVWSSTPQSTPVPTTDGGTVNLSISSFGEDEQGELYVVHYNGALYRLQVYTVGGTVSGLSGTGLVLQNNGGDDLAVSANGAFAFVTPLDDGDAYDVTVQSQPTDLSQTCVVSNGSGTIAGADVTDVSVVCTTNTYTVGGTLSGLSGTGLVLQNNGGDDLALSADGTFTFATALDDGSAFDVTVQTQPTDLSQTCVVSNGSGTLAGAPVTDVSVVCTTNTYTVGGTLSGLSGTGLVLQNNGGDDLALSADGTFTFATALDDGSAFDVTVQTQPTDLSQTCVVSNGSGTLAGADVTSVSVDCTTNTYTVGGTLSGLSGTGLVLRNNGGDDLALSADGTFTFATALDDGSDFAVTVQTQPTDPSQTCVVSKGSGTVAGADVTDVTVVCTSSYSVGGTVSGLSGTGLVLQNNGGDDLAVSANGAFTFATALADSSNYEVTVLSQPTDLSQTCVVSSASGTLAGADVTSVSVVCTTNTYTVGGTLSGLSGTGLVLQNNGGDDLALSADGAFTFATALIDGSDYDVTVQTQPSDPVQACSVTSGSGSLAGAEITDVSVVCVTGSADLAVTKSDNQDILVPGDPITYMITVSHSGPEDVIGVQVQDILPAELSQATWECFPMGGAICGSSGSGDIDDLADIPAGGSVNYVLTAATEPDFRGVISNTVTVTPPVDISDPDLDNNSATDRAATQAVFLDGFEEPMGALKRWLEESQ